jgi:hypothetical protein
VCSSPAVAFIGLPVQGGIIPSLKHKKRHKTALVRVPLYALKKTRRALGDRLLQFNAYVFNCINYTTNTGWGKPVKASFS